MTSYFELRIRGMLTFSHSKRLITRHRGRNNVCPLPATSGRRLRPTIFSLRHLKMTKSRTLRRNLENCFSQLFYWFFVNDLRLDGLDRDLHAAVMKILLLIPVITIIIYVQQTSCIEFMYESQSYGGIPSTELENLILYLFLRWSENTRYL